MRGGQQVSLRDRDNQGLLVKPDVARKQMDMESAAQPAAGPSAGTTIGRGSPASRGQTHVVTPAPGRAPEPPKSKRFHGTVALDATRVGRDASRIADEVIAHLSGLVGATVTVTLEVEAEIPSGAPDHVVRTVTENSRTLKFTSHGFERE